MKLAPGPLPPISTSYTMDRLPISLPFSSDLLWRYPLGFSSVQSPQVPSSPLLDYKSQLPTSLASDPRVWSRDDVITFLKWSEKEFDLQPIDMDMFQINGKAMCLLTRTDLSERAPGCGDVLHNVLQLLVREANIIQRCFPSSPVTPTTRQPYPFSPHSTNPPTPTWNVLSQNSEFSHSNNLAAHLIAQSNSVTLSPAPSIDSQAGSPQNSETIHGSCSSTFNGQNNFNVGGNGSGSNQSDSDDDSYIEGKNGRNNSPPCTPNPYAMYPMAISNSGVLPKSPKENPSSFKVNKREFFPSDSSEPNTNGRLLWDFLQQLLNDPSQRYTNYIAWKDMLNGVFKIVDPAGLAKLWGIQKNHLSMNYDKMSRALRYYYRVNILRKVQGERHCYQFLRNPSELKNIKNISLLKQQVSPTRTTAPAQVLIKNEPVENDQQEQIRTNTNAEFEDKPTDLSINSRENMSFTTNSVNDNDICSPDHSHQSYYVKKEERQ